MDNGMIKLKIITPDGKFYDGEVKRVVIRTTEGEMGILDDHAPTTVALSTGTCTILTDDQEIKGLVHGGFTEIKERQVTLLPDAAEWPNEIDIERAKQAKKRAEDQLADNKDHVEAKLALERAITRLEVMEWYNGHN